MAGTRGMQGVGRKKEPRALRVLKSPDGGKHDQSWKEIEEEVAFSRYCPEKPDNLTSAASRHWDEITPELIRNNILTPHHAGALTILCETFARWKMLQRRWEEDQRPVIEDKLKNPLLSALTEAGNQYRSYASEFGLTPASESKLGSKEASSPGGQNPFAARPSAV